MFLDDGPYKRREKKEKNSTLEYAAGCVRDPFGFAPRPLGTHTASVSLIVLSLYDYAGTLRKCIDEWSVGVSRNIEGDVNGESITISSQCA